MSARNLVADKLLWEKLGRWKRSSPELDRIHFTFDAGQVSMRFVWFRLFEICVLKFGSGFGNWELEV
jgi:hypothetical protein